MPYFNYSLKDRQGAASGPPIVQLVLGIDRDLQGAGSGPVRSLARVGATVWPC
jgi:hypothetical protein